MIKFQVLAVGAIACLLTGALLGSGVQGYQVAQKPEIQPSPQPTDTPTPQAASIPSPQPSSPPVPPAPSARAVKAVVYTPGYDGANLRDMPSQQQGYIEGILRDGTVVTLGARSGEYISIVTADGVKGWLHQSTIRRN